MSWALHRALACSDVSGCIQISIDLEATALAGIISQSLEHSAVLVASSIVEAVDFANAFAPDHLEIITSDPLSVLRNISHAGSVFLGGYTPVAAGDYASGTNHVLPTSGFARTFSGLNVDHYEEDDCADDNRSGAFEP